jgi:hypothetical protein
MPLNWNVTDVKNHKRVMYSKNEDGTYKMKPIYETIILSTMIVGMRGITEKNYEKFFNRLRLVESVNGAFFFETKRGKHHPRYIKKEEIKKMIGLKTNASELTRNKFLKRFDKDKL